MKDEIVRVPWTEKRAGAQDKCRGAGTDTSCSASSLAGSIDAGRAGRIAFHICPAEPPSKTRSDENVTSGMPIARRPREIGAPSVFSRKQRSGSRSASATRTYPAVLTTAHGRIRSSAAVDRGRFGDFELCARLVKQWSGRANRKFARRRGPSVPVAPVISNRTWHRLGFSRQAQRGFL